MKLPVFLLMACTDPNEGTVVGNPGDAAARLAPTSAELVMDEAEAMVSAIELFSCGGEVTEVDLSGFEEEEGETEFDLLDDTVELPAGSWCAVGIEVERIELEGSGPSDSAFFVELEPGWIEVEAQGGFTIDGQAFVLELAEPGWLSAALLNIEDGGVVELGPDDALHDALADTVALRSALFEDPDDNGELGDAERDEGAIAAGGAREQDVSDTGTSGFQETVSLNTTTGNCGRSRVQGAAVFLLFPLVFLGFRRR